MLLVVLCFSLSLSLSFFHFFFLLFVSNLELFELIEYSFFFFLAFFSFSLYERVSCERGDKNTIIID